MEVRIIIVSLVTLVLSACDQTKTSKQVLAVKKEQKLVVKSNAKITFDVEGMVCKMACGGSIRKSLIQSGSVERVEINFDKKAISQEVIIYYDSTKMSPIALKNIIENTNDGQFAVIDEKPISTSK